jgi:hypothetical protein
MSVAEIRSEVAKMSREERLDLEAYLLFLAQEEDPKYQAMLDERIRRMERGEVATAADFEAAHARLCAEGR